ncbi:double-strand break repair protein MRE11, putative [Plasmodium ovale]|uniref:Double-strand break repair protein MRE11, putative n=1 Tax=Plasmodium ovale TaxID=36330 RepID=A0A1D3KWT3_PLAOA|nr:double-strand break repair protein MRE11, putative [Plasmodium ovale]
MGTDSDNTSLCSNLYISLAEKSNGEKNFEAEKNAFAGAECEGSGENALASPFAPKIQVPRSSGGDAGDSCCADNRSATQGKEKRSRVVSIKHLYKNFHRTSDLLLREDGSESLSHKGEVKVEDYHASNVKKRSTFEGKNNSEERNNSYFFSQGEEKEFSSGAKLHREESQTNEHDSFGEEKIQKNVIAGRNSRIGSDSHGGSNSRENDDILNMGLQASAVLGKMTRSYADEKFLELKENKKGHASGKTNGMEQEKHSLIGKELNRCNLEEEKIYKFPVKGEQLPPVKGNTGKVNLANDGKIFPSFEMAKKDVNQCKDYSTAVGETSCSEDPPFVRKEKKYNLVNEEEGGCFFKTMNINDIKEVISINEPCTLKVLLCTDNHLGYKENNSIQKKDTFNSFEEILFIAKKLNVDMILNSGDLFHKNKVSEFTLYRTMSIMRRYCLVDREGGVGLEEACAPDVVEGDEAKRERNVAGREETKWERNEADREEAKRERNEADREEAKRERNEADREEAKREKNMKRNNCWGNLTELRNYAYDYYEEHKTGESQLEPLAGGKCNENGGSRIGDKGNKGQLDNLQSSDEKGSEKGSEKRSEKGDEKEEKKKIRMNGSGSKARAVRERFEKCIPFFTMHGNHDYPYGYEYICPLDILSISNLINYIGKSSIDNIVVKPILLNKNETKISIYAIGWIKDDRLYRSFEKKEVKFILPEDYKGRINILVLHQNRYMRNSYGNNTKNYIKESFIPDFIDLVIWGHEHFSKPYLEESMFNKFYNLQLGSSVRTSLCTNEYGDKHIGLLEIKNERFRFLKIKLETVRPFELIDIRLSNFNINFKDESILNNFLHNQMDTILAQIKENLQEQVKRYYLFKRLYYASNDGKKDTYEETENGENINENAISEEEVKKFYLDLKNEDFYSSTFIHLAFSNKDDTFDLLKVKKQVYSKPLLKMKVQYDDINIINTQLFGSTYIDNIANPSECLTFYRKKVKGIDIKTKDNISTYECVENKDDVNMEYLNEYNKIFDILFNYCDFKNKLCILDEKVIMDTVQNFIMNMNSSFNSNSNNSSDYISLHSMVNISSERKIELLEHALRDVAVESVTEAHLDTLTRNKAVP